MKAGCCQSVGQAATLVKRPGEKSVTQTKQGTAVITGGGSGIGEACARRFAKDGYDIAIIDQNRAGAERVAGDLQADGVKTGVYIGDVSDAKAMQDIAMKVEDEVGPVATLVTSAGILNNPNTILGMDLDEHQHVWDVNYNGTIYAVRAFAPFMEKRRAGAIVTVGSVNSFIQLPLPAYNPSKAAIKRLTELLCMELGRNNIRVNGVAPNYTMTPAFKAKIESGERDPENVRRSGAISMLIEPYHVANAVAFLCSHDAEAITGVMLPVDAGYLCAAYYQTFAGGVPWDD
jgi:NAD(P)-dependent dehydrogenase (short-subunit alcohol dehydrogenase family)